MGRLPAYALTMIPLIVFFAIWAQYRYAVTTGRHSFARMLRAHAIAAAISLIFPVVVALLGHNIWRLWVSLLGGYFLVSLAAYAVLRFLGVGPDPHTTPRVRVTRR